MFLDGLQLEQANSFVKKFKWKIYQKIYQKNLKKCLQLYIGRAIIINGSLVKRLRRRPLTAETRVRFPYGLLVEEASG